MLAAGWAGAAIAWLPEIVRSLEAVQHRLRIGRNVPDQPVSEETARGVGIVEHDRQRLGIRRRAVEPERRRRVLPVAGVLARDRIAVVERGALDLHRRLATASSQQNEQQHDSPHAIKLLQSIPMPTFFEMLSELMAAEIPLVTVTVVDTAGSVPQDRGAKMIVTAEGLRFGTVGGGRIETKAIAEAQKMLRGEITNNTHFAQWNLAKDVGMTCGGVVKLYFESYNAGSWNIVIFGAGHVANALVTLLIHLDCRITLFDPRQEWIDKLPRSPKLTPHLTADMPSRVKTLPDNAFVILMTMGHTTDKPILIEILRTRTFPYLGVIGSVAKANTLKRDLEAAG